MPFIRKFALVNPRHTYTQTNVCTRYWLGKLGLRRIWRKDYCLSQIPKQTTSVIRKWDCCTASGQWYWAGG